MSAPVPQRLALPEQVVRGVPVVRQMQVVREVREVVVAAQSPRRIGR